MSSLRYELLHQDETSHARLGRVTTPHGSFDTPAFMPVGTQATVMGVLPEMLGRGGAEVHMHIAEEAHGNDSVGFGGTDLYHRTEKRPKPGAIGAQIILANTYHLMLRPGSELIARMGGLHQWMRWQGPILTDSGGYQVFSLSDINEIDDHGVRFRSHLDGKLIDLPPERSMRVQNELGADIIMAFDDCPPASLEHDEIVDGLGTARRHAISAAEYAKRNRIAADRTAAWLERCKAAHARPNEQALFGIVQGGTDLELRSHCVEQVCGIDLPGYAIGGVAVGEGHELIEKVVEHTAPLLPGDRPRYLMGVGYERDIVAAVRAGVDMFDCVLPTRNGRNANAFTPTGQVRLRNAACTDDPAPIDAACDCPACAAGFSRSYIRHLFLAKEMLGPILVSLHNLRHFQRLLLDIRGAIAHNDWSGVARRWPVAFAPADAPGAGSQKR